MEITPEKLRKLQLLELEILLEIKRICEKHSIPFILIGGTLIGAVRHKGFIPWDDDVDIGMLREHFDRFCKIAPNELSEKFFLQTPETDDQYANYYLTCVRLNNTKVIRKQQPKNMIHNGIYIDVLVYDNIPNSYWQGYFFWSILNIIFRAYILRKGYLPRPKNIFARLVMYLGVILCLPISTNKLKSILENYYKNYKNLYSKYVVLLAGTWGFRKERHLRETIIEITSLLFEGELMPVPQNYDLFLREQYGDYMTPPPEEKRKMRHASEIDFGIYG
jgi:lipopolysaccharide cholinephosphotransferase